jgi:hypothetical protein
MRQNAADVVDLAMLQATDDLFALGAAVADKVSERIPHMDCKKAIAAVANLGAIRELGRGIPAGRRLQSPPQTLDTPANPWLGTDGPTQ